MTLDNLRGTIFQSKEFRRIPKLAFNTRRSFEHGVFVQFPN